MTTERTGLIEPGTQMYGDKPSFIPKDIELQAATLMRVVSRLTPLDQEYLCKMDCTFCTSKFTLELVPYHTKTLEITKYLIDEKQIPPQSIVFDANSRENIFEVPNWKERINELVVLGVNVIVSTRGILNKTQTSFLLKKNQELAKVESTLVVLTTIPCLDPALSKQFEVKAPPPQSRVESVIRAKKTGLPVVIDITPVFPHTSDADLIEILKIATEHDIPVEAGSLYLPEKEMRALLNTGDYDQLGLSQSQLSPEFTPDTDTNLFDFYLKKGILTTWEPGNVDALQGGKAAWAQNQKTHGITYRYEDPRINQLADIATENNTAFFSSYMDTVAHYQLLFK